MLVDLRPCFRMRGNGMFTEVRRCPALTGHTRLDILLADHNLPPDRQPVAHHHAKCQAASGMRGTSGTQTRRDELGQTCR